MEASYSFAITEPLPGESAIYRSPHAVKELINSPDPANFKTLRDNLIRAREKFSDLNCLGRKMPDGHYEWKNYKTALQMAENFASGLVALDMVPSIKEFKNYELHLFGVYSKNREEYIIADFAAILFGLTSVPIYDTLGVQAMEFILDQTKVTTIVGSGECVKKFIEGKKYGYVKNIILFDPITDTALLEEISKSGVKLYTFQQIIDIGAEKPQKPFPVEEKTLYVISYTSGTTGNPKGAMMTHANLISLISFGNAALDLAPTDVYLSYLPMAHIFERLMHCQLYYHGCAVASYGGDPTKIKDDFMACRPTIIATVPRVLNRFHEIFKGIIDGLHGVKGWLARHALNTKLNNLHYYGNIHHWIHDKLVFHKFKEALGGRLRWIAIGSAPTSKDTLDFMKVALCIPIVEGYGQTESTGASFVMSMNDHRGSGCVGGPGVNTEFKLTDVPEMKYTSKDKDEKGNKCPRGEMCIRGPGVFAGYYKDEEKTKEAIDENGWLHTGDICQLNVNGTIKIIDRKKNIFKLSFGEYIAPEKLENIFKLSKSVSEIFVYGDPLESFLVAVIVPNMKVLQEMAAENGIKEGLEELLHDKKVKMLVINDLKATGATKKLQSFEYVKNVLLDKDAFATKDLITTTFKLKRFEAKKVYSDQIAELYKEGPLIH